MINNKTAQNSIFSYSLQFKGLGIIFLVIILDQITKSIASMAITEVMLKTAGIHQGIKVTSFFNIVQVWNKGVSFGMLSGGVSQLTLSLITLVIMGFLIKWMMKIDKWYLMTAVSMIIGGAIGNLADRIRFGAVSDFLDFHIFGYHWPSFNIADSAIVIGVAIILFDDLIIKGKEKQVSARRKK